jgi:hypothetical protein
MRPPLGDRRTGRPGTRRGRPALLPRTILNLKYQWQRVLLPRGLMVGQAALAVLGFTLVLLVAWKG